MVDSVDCIEHNSYSPETRGKEREKQREKELREEGKCERDKGRSPVTLTYAWKYTKMCS